MSSRCARNKHVHKAQTILRIINHQSSCTKHLHYSLHLCICRKFRFDRQFLVATRGSVTMCSVSCRLTLTLTLSFELKRSKVKVTKSRKRQTRNEPYTKQGITVIYGITETAYHVGHRGYFVVYCNSRLLVACRARLQPAATATASYIADQHRTRSVVMTRQGGQWSVHGTNSSNSSS